jgi:recombination protein RecA
MARKKKEEVVDLPLEQLGDANIDEADLAEFEIIPDENDIFFSTGDVLLDEALGGGWPLSKIVNVVGDSGTGKTLLAIDAVINFLLKFPTGRVFYNEIEAAFTTGYAKNKLGMPTEKTTFLSTPTVEDLYKSIVDILEKYPNEECLYIIDSLDAMTDQTEEQLEMVTKTYGASKPKQLSKMFRKLVRKMKNGKMTLFVISQIRDRLDISWGKSYARSGGKALNFYSSQIVYLAECGKIKKTNNKIERVMGIRIKTKIEKSKTGRPFRVCQFPVYSEYGVDTVQACLEFLEQTGKLSELSFPAKRISPLAEKFRNMSILPDAELKEMITKRNEITDLARKIWVEVEESFSIKGKKYF